MGKVTVPKGFDPKVMRHWYLVANRTDALIYEGNLNGGFKFVKRLQNAAGRKQDSELVSDRPGRSFSSSRSGVRHGFAPHTQYHDVVAGQFARRIATLLDRAALDEEYSDLVIVAEPGFLGSLNKETTKRVRGLVRRELPLEWKRGSDQELEEFLQKKLA